MAIHDLNQRNALIYVATYKDEVRALFQMSRPQYREVTSVASSTSNEVGNCYNNCTVNGNRVTVCIFYRFLNFSDRFQRIANTCHRGELTVNILLPDFHG